VTEMGVTEWVES